MKYLEAKARKAAMQNKVLPPAENKAPPVTPESAAPKVKPSVRALADELGVDLSRIHGTGVKGAITEQDVQIAHISKKPAPPSSAGASLSVSATTDTDS